MKTAKILAISILMLGFIDNTRGQIATNPGPADGAIHSDAWVQLSWSPGTGAVSHDVYFGEDYDEVNNAVKTSNTFLGNTNVTQFLLGFPGFPYPDGLVPCTTYYWRIDEVAADNVTIHRGEVWSFTVLGSAPVANAGPDQTVRATATGSAEVVLNGSGSTTPGGVIISYEWQINSSGTTVTGINPTVTLSIGVHEIILRVENNCGGTDSDVVIITVQRDGISPIADAGPDQIVMDFGCDGSESVTLDGSGSTDPDGYIVSYQWWASATGDPADMVLIAEGRVATVILPGGTYTVMLTVADNEGYTDSDTVEITVSINSGDKLCGTVTTTDPDTFIHVLRHVMVTLDWGGTEHTVFTNDNGDYVIDMSNDTTFYVGSTVTGFLRVTLQDEGYGDADNPKPYIAVYDKEHDDANPVFAETVNFNINTLNDLVQNVDFSSNANISRPAWPVPRERLDDAAIIYFHTYQALDFALNTLGLSLDCTLPVEVFAWSNSRTLYWGTISEIEIAKEDGNSEFQSGNRPDNREWHEFGHFIMDDSMIAGDNALPILHTGGFPIWPPEGFPPWPPAPTSGDTNHGGYDNHCTSDSWTEGYAECVSCLIAKETGDPNPSWYAMYGNACAVNIEANWRAWEMWQAWGGPAEEFALAGLLWDLLDGINAADSDWIDLSIGELWPLLNRAEHQNIHDIYETLNSSVLPELTGNGDSVSDSIDNLDELFIAHGFFSDADGDETYDEGEEVGLTGDAARPNREATPAIPGSYIKVNVFDSSTQAEVEESEFYVEMRVEPPHDYLNADFTIRKRNQSLYFIMPPPQYSAKAYIYAKKDGYRDSEPLVIDSSFYWEKVREPDTEYFTEHTFYLTVDILPPGLIAYWKLDETEGDIAPDSAGTNHATLSGAPLWQPQGGRVGGAILFDGIDDCLITPFILNPAKTQFSVFAWIRGGRPGEVILSQIDIADWLYADPSQGRLATSLGLTAGHTFPPSLVSEFVIVDGMWHQVGIVWDGMQLRLYVDGLIAAENAQAVMPDSENGFYIGCGKSRGAGTFWSGLIDDVCVYNVAVSPAEIAGLTE